MSMHAYAGLRAANAAIPPHIAGACIRLAARFPELLPLCVRLPASRPSVPCSAQPGIHPSATAGPRLSSISQTASPKPAG